MIPIPGLSKLWSGLAMVGAGIVLVLGILFMGRSWGTSSEKAKNLKAKVKGQKAALKTAQDAATIQAKASSDVADVAKRRQREKKEAQKKPGWKFGKWGIIALLLPFFLLAVVGCGAPRVEIIRPPIMELTLLPRPGLHEVHIEDLCLTQEQLNMLWENEFSLITTIEQYEALIQAHQEFVRRYKASEEAE